MVFSSECPPRTAGWSSREGAPRDGRGWRLPSHPSNGTVPAQDFPKAERLLKRHEFLRLAGHGRKIHTHNFIVLQADSAGATTRIGATVSRRTGNAVVRNRIKRMIREFYRLNKGLFVAADYNIIAKPGAARLEFPEISRELSRALQRL
jgi:ribonuclease P protein component